MTEMLFLIIPKNYLFCYFHYVRSCIMYRNKYVLQSALDNLICQI